MTLELKYQRQLGLNEFEVAVQQLEEEFMKDLDKQLMKIERRKKQLRANKAVKL